VLIQLRGRGMLSEEDEEEGKNVISFFMEVEQETMEVKKEFA